MGTHLSSLPLIFVSLSMKMKLEATSGIHLKSSLKEKKKSRLAFTGPRRSKSGSEPSRSRCNSDSPSKGAVRRIMTALKNF